jgi:hypothetical protein
MISLEKVTFDSRFNWKVLTDNFMEAYHHIAIHRDTLEPLFPAKLSHTPDNEGPYSVLHMPSKEGAASESGDLHELVAANVFPFHLFAPTQGSLTWCQILPHSVDHFTERIFSCFSRETLDDPFRAEEVEGLRALGKAVYYQDIDACESVWAGLSSTSFEAGRLSSLEKPIWAFNQWWIARMADAK